VQILKGGLGRIEPETVRGGVEARSSRKHAGQVAALRH
jgi:hypothetical protein